MSYIKVGRVVIPENISKLGKYSFSNSTFDIVEYRPSNAEISFDVVSDQNKYYSVFDNQCIHANHSIPF